MKLVEFVIRKKGTQEGKVSRGSRFLVKDGLPMSALADEFRQHGQLSRIDGVKVAFSREDRERRPDQVINL